MGVSYDHGISLLGGSGGGCCGPRALFFRESMLDLLCLLGLWKLSIMV